MKTEKTYEKITITALPGSEIEIVGSVSANILNAYRQRALKNINDTIKIDGFRDGNVPEKILLARVGEKAILEEMAELALSDVYPAIVLDHKLDPLGRPQVAITKLAAENPLEFTIRTAVMPAVTVGDYKKIAGETAPKEKRKKDFTVEEKEIDEALARFKKSHEDAHQVDGNHGHEEHDHASFDTPEFRQKIKEALAENKRLEAAEKRRIAMADKIVESATIDMPKVLVNTELNRIEAQFKDDIARAGASMDDYLKHAKKTLEEIRKEWLPAAEKKARLQLIIDKIAELEKIRAEEKDIEAEVAHILKHYKDADPERARIYAAGVLTNEKVFQFLEKLAGETVESAPKENSKEK